MAPSIAPDATELAARAAKVHNTLYYYNGTCS